jgi:hypothetical protein
MDYESLSYGVASGVEGIVDPLDKIAAVFERFLPADPQKQDPFLQLGKRITFSLSDEKSFFFYISLDAWSMASPAGKLLIVETNVGEPEWVADEYADKFRTKEVSFVVGSFSARAKSVELAEEFLAMCEKFREFVNTNPPALIDDDDDELGN